MTGVPPDVQTQVVSEHDAPGWEAEGLGSRGGEMGMRHTMVLSRSRDPSVQGGWAVGWCSGAFHLRWSRFSLVAGAVARRWKLTARGLPCVVEADDRGGWVVTIASTTVGRNVSLPAAIVEASAGLIGLREAEKLGATIDRRVALFRGPVAQVVEPFALDGGDADRNLPGPSPSRRDRPLRRRSRRPRGGTAGEANSNC